MRPNLGGLLRSLELLEVARHLRMPVVIGAPRGGSSLLTRAGIALARAVGSPYAHEGGLGSAVLSREAVRPELRVGMGGTLELAGRGLGTRGFGLRPLTMVRA